jgi:hypothetical protein
MNANEVIKIGDPDVTVSGRQRYVITYTVGGAMNSFADHDELFWNVDGALWPVPKMAVSATVQISGGGVLDSACYQGEPGSTETCTHSTTDATADFSSTRELASGEEMSVAVSLPDARLMDLWHAADEKTKAKMLRILQDGSFERVGSNKTLRANVRLIAATNQNLEELVEEGLFRRDLYYRLKVFAIRIPPLRERLDDLPLLVEYFIRLFNDELRKSVRNVSGETLELLKRHSWPGNIRELQNLVERSVILSPGPVLHIPVPDAVPDSGNVRWTLPVSKDENPERERILDALRVSSGVVGGPEGAAATLGLRRTTLQSRMKKLGIARHFR